MSATMLIVRRVVVLASFGTVGWACSPKPAAIDITCQATCREGTTIQVAAEVKDAKGRVLPLPITWTVEPSSAGKLEGAKLLCQSEGKLLILANAGIGSVREVAVTSPLIGTWQRQADDYAGMRLRISSGDDGSLAGYIVGPPNDAALPAIKSERKMDDGWAEAMLACSAHAWSPGLKKWNSIRRLGAMRWSVSDLNKDIRVGRASCDEDDKKSQYLEGYELSLVDANKLELRNLRVNKAPQSWLRIPDADEGVIAGQKAACEKALDVAAKAYSDLVPGLSETAKEVSGKFWNGNSSLTDYQTAQRLVAALKSAQASLSKGAYSARQAARAVPTKAAVPEVKRALELSDAMFAACKEVAP